MKTLHKCFTILFFVPFLLAAAPSFGQTSSQMKAERDAAHWLTNFRQHPDFEKILPNEMTMTAHCNECVDCCNDMGIELDGFTSGIVWKNPDKLDSLAQQFKKENRLGTLVYATLYSGLPNARELVKNLVKNNPVLEKKFAKELNSTSPLRIEDQYPVEKFGYSVYLFWLGQYIATGEAKPIEKMIPALQWYEKEGTASAKSFAAKKVLEFLASSVKDDKKILEVCENYEKATKNQKISKLLKEIIASSKSPHHTPESNR
jgi:hypothetical protein